MAPPTQIMPIGLIGNPEGACLNIADYRINFQTSKNKIKVILVVGTAMNAGKTFTAASMIRGLKGSGFRVAGIKATGTGSGGDLWQMKDMGADVILDFTDAGFASTYKAPDEAIEKGVLGLIHHAARRKCEFAIVEIADGLQHLETATLLRTKTLQAITFGVVFAAYDSLGAKAGFEELRKLGYSLLAISGQITRSPLAMREAAAATSICPILTPFQIQAGMLAPVITGANNRKTVTVLEERIQRTMSNPNNFIVDFEEHQHQAMQSWDVDNLENAYDFVYPKDLGETV
jgi:hypothetical protein